MTEIEVEIDQDIYRAALAEAQVTGRTVGQQVSHWARIAREADVEWQRLAGR